MGAANVADDGKDLRQDQKVISQTCMMGFFFFRENAKDMCDEILNQVLLVE
jgi:hypothetical protein